jgi:hypothetical protein
METQSNTLQAPANQQIQKDFLDAAAVLVNNFHTSVKKLGENHGLNVDTKVMFKLLQDEEQ